MQTVVMTFSLGFMVMWDTVANATGYRVFRKAAAGTPGTLLATVSSAEAAKFSTFTNTPNLAALDPEGDPNAKSGFGYWVEAAFADGSVSAPGPFATPSVAPPLGSMPSLTVPNLKVSASGTKTITFDPPSAWGVGGGSQQVPGSDLTWSWDPLPSSAPAYVYFLTIQLPAGMMGGWTLYRSDVVWSPAQAPFHVMTTATTVGPPYTFAWPSGQVVQVCVSPLAIGKILAAGGSLPGGTSCLATQVP
jgi:hypothetical protein